MTSPAFAAASRWHSLATRAMPLARDSNSLAWCKPSAMRACLLLADAVRTYVTEIDDAGFLLMRWVHSPGEIAGCPGQQDYCSVPNPKNQTQSPQNWKIWAFWSDFGSCFLEVDFFGGGRGNRNRPNPTIIWNFANTVIAFGGSNWSKSTGSISGVHTASTRSSVLRILPACTSEYFEVRYCGYCLHSGLCTAHAPSTRSIWAFSSARTPGTRNI